jgi:hypothetical protein
VTTSRNESSKHGPHALLAAVIVPLVFALTLATFAWPSARVEPRDLPLGVAGPVDATRGLEQKLARAGDGAFDLHRYADEAAARAAIEDREVYAAVVASREGVTVLTASASSPLMAGILERLVAERSGSGAPKTVDVAPADEDDPRGAVLNSLVLPLVLSSVIAGVFVSRRGRPGLMQAGALLTTAAVAGLVGIAMVQGWLDALQGSWLENAGVLALTMLAIASFVTGSAAVFGHAGLSLSALLMILVGNPWSGISAAPELLPTPVGTIGQLLPPGAGGNLLRSTSFFEGAGGGGHLTVLLAWIALGGSMIAAAALVNRRRAARAPVRAETGPGQIGRAA